MDGAYIDTARSIVLDVCSTPDFVSVAEYRHHDIPDAPSALSSPYTISLDVLLQRMNDSYVHGFNVFCNGSDMLLFHEPTGELRLNDVSYKLKRYDYRSYKTDDNSLYFINYSFFEVNLFTCSDTTKQGTGDICRRYRDGPLPSYLKVTKYKPFFEEYNYICEIIQWNDGSANLEPVIENSALYQLAYK